MSQLVTLSPGLKSHEIDKQTFFLSLWRRRALRIEFNRSVSITLYLPHLASGYNENFLELELLIFSLLLTQWSSDSAPISLPLSELSNISHGVFTPSVFNVFPLGAVCLCRCEHSNRTGSKTAALRPFEQESYKWTVTSYVASFFKYIFLALLTSFIG